MTPDNTPIKTPLYHGRFSLAFIDAELNNRLGTNNHDENQYLRFGEYRGLRYREVPDYYLDWMVFKQVKTRSALLEIKRRMLGSNEP
jgi:hypothetical protein